MFRIWLEWDYGQDNFIFSTKDKAIQWVNNLIETEELQDDFPNGFNDLSDEHLCGLIELTIDP